MSYKQLQLKPNPSGEIRLATNEDLSGSLVIINDLDGREAQRELLTKNGLSISKKAGTGLYFIQVITTKKQIYPGKILLQL
ncbi:T9SS type A sorting domain-containing protein [Chitinophaga sp. RAB17]|uniref:T9SS type A sorting domain-containing protein n=1 Tax=Chitinophaga sp. RAB17 TaxID=3233049 RepID=UPI003F9273A6